MKKVKPKESSSSSSKAVTDLSVNPRNPRIITDAKLNQLKRSMKEFGDISGIVFNVRDGLVYGGTQRTKNLPSDARVVIERRYEKPTTSGTVAEGYVEHDGERFSYREVDWSPAKAKAAMIAANNNAGSWDRILLTESMRELASFDVNFDLDLTMFSPEEIQKKFTVHPTPGEDEGGEKNPSKLVHECPRCGYEFR